MSDRTLNADRKSSLLKSIQAQRCVLFLGPGAAVAPSGKTIEDDLIETVRSAAGLLPDQPPPERLSHLCQLAGNNTLKDIREKVAGYYGKMEASGFTTKAHESFARMSFPLVIQLTPDPLMVNAIAAAKQSCQTACYDYSLPPQPLVEDGSTRLVYGLRGLWKAPRSIPLSTDEDISHLVALVRENPKVPEALSAKLRGSGTDQRSALFVGFDFGSWQTRMLLRGLFAVAPTTINMPEPAVASLPRRGSLTVIAPDEPSECPHGPSAEDREFLWSCFRLIFTEDPPDEFAVRLEAELQALKPPAAQRTVNQGTLRRFLEGTLPENGGLPETELTNLGFDIEDFQISIGQAWETMERGTKARRLIGWMRDGRLDQLMARIERQVPELYAKYCEELYRR